MPRRKTTASSPDTLSPADTRPIIKREKTPRVASLKSPRVRRTAKKASAKPTAVRAAAAPVSAMDAQRQEPLSIRMPDTVAPQNKSMSSLQCFTYGGTICLIGTVSLGLLLGFVVIPPLAASYEQSQISYAATPALSPDSSSLKLPQTEGLSNAAAQSVEYGFYGTLLSKEENVLMVQELLPPLPLEEQSTATEKAFVVRVSEQTAYTHQRQRAANNSTAPLFSPESGLLENIKEQMYVFVSTRDNPENTDTVEAAHIIYSEDSPFAK